MQNLSRKAFFGQAFRGLAALAAAGSSAQAQLVYRRTDWKIEEFNHLLHVPARIKQVFDINLIADGKFLNGIKNSLNGLHFGFGLATEQVQIVGALHGPANLLNYDDAAWAKYRVGEWLGVTDPATGKPARRNPFYASKAEKTSKEVSQDPNREDSVLQDTSMQILQSRGVKFLSCHTALEEQARLLVKHWGLSEQPEEIVRDLLGHLQPGVLVVASMVAAIAMLQGEGHYSYVTV